ncbi:MAG: PPC domain-containing protein [Nitrososphaeria archaeon]|nr:PPC domain-containing protein [Nitrososphaeria archaeon]MDW7987045.1 PPC domain-containing protein [Nitrososphaerota archaeon]
MKEQILTTILLVSIFAFFLHSTDTTSGVEPGIGFSTATELKEETYSFYMDGTRNHFFKIWLEANQIIHIILRVPADVDLDMYLLSPERDVMERSDFGRGLTERISYQAPYQGYYYIVIVPFLGSKGLYTITLLIDDLPTKTMSITLTETFTVYETISEPTVVVNTVTKTVYETFTTTQIEYIEKFPWVFLGLTIIAISIIVGFRMVLESLKPSREKSSQQSS